MVGVVFGMHFAFCTVLFFTCDMAASSLLNHCEAFNYQSIRCSRCLRNLRTNIVMVKICIQLSMLLVGKSDKVSTERLMLA